MGGRLEGRLKASSKLMVIESLIVSFLFDSLMVSFESEVSSLNFGVLRFSLQTNVHLAKSKVSQAIQAKLSQIKFQIPISKRIHQIKALM